MTSAPPSTTGALAPDAGLPHAATTTVPTAIVVATAPGGPDGVAAALPFEDTTLLGRVLDQLASIGVRDVHVLARGDRGARVLEPVLAGRAGVALHPSDDLAADLRHMAAVLREAPAGVLVMQGDVLIQQSVVGGLVTDPRASSRILTTQRPLGRPWAYAVRLDNGRVRAAASPFHMVRGEVVPFLGLLRVDARDREAAAGIAERLAALAADPPEGWRTHREVVRPGNWRLAYGRLLASQAQGRDDEDPDDAGLDHSTDFQHPDEVELGPEDTARLEAGMAAAGQDVVALLLVGLVRSGLDVRTYRLRHFLWQRPLDQDAVARARQRLLERDEDRLRMDAAVKDEDGFFTTFFVSPYSRYIARWAALRGLTPNQVTIFSMALGVLAAAGFATGERWGLVAGAVLLQAAFTFDCVDGQLARYARRYSQVGAWLDAMLDRGKEYVVYAGLAIGAAQAGDDVWLLACAAIALQTTRHAVDFSMPGRMPAPAEAEEVVHPPLEDNLDGPGSALPRWARGVTTPRRRRPARASQPKAAPPARGLRRLLQSPAAGWARKALLFPIGERFAVISVTAAVFDAPVTFIALLALGGQAMVRAVLSRVLRARRNARSGPVLGPERIAKNRTFRDDGLLAGVVGAAGRAIPLPAATLAAAAAAVLLAAVAVTGEDAPDAVAAVAIGIAVLLAGASAGRPHTGPQDWAVPGLLRAVEFAGITWLAGQEGAGAVPAAFALLLAIAIRHYNNVYRLRQRGPDDPDRIGALSLGWDGRLVLTFLLVAVVGEPAGLYVAAAALAALFAWDAAQGWIDHGRARQDYDEDDDATLEDMA